MVLSPVPSVPYTRLVSTPFVKLLIIAKRNTQENPRIHVSVSRLNGVWPPFFFSFLYFIVFIPKFYKRQAKMYHNTSFIILTQKRIQDEKKKENEKREKEKKRENKEKKKVGGGGIETYYNVNKTSTYTMTSRRKKT